LVRKFLYVIASLIFLLVGVGAVWTIYGQDLIRMVSVPDEPFVAPAPVATNAYADKALWVARPDMPGNPATWLPKGATMSAKRGNAAVFFIHPTSFLQGDGWNASLDDSDTTNRASLFVRGQASAFNDVGDVWAPRYRQAAFGAFLTDQKEAKQAIDAAYADVALAFDQFVKEAGKRPIILAGHSQGALHLTNILRQKVANQPIAKQIVAAYVIGWPVSIETDLPVIGMPACARADQKGCLASFQSYGEPGDTSQVETAYDATIGFTGIARKGTNMVCTNPLTGMNGGTAAAAANLGTLFNEPDFTGGRLEVARVPATCTPRGFLMIGEGPALGPYVLPGKNYHVYDYSLFWANIRADAARRLGGTVTGAAPAKP
jgi:hypothetical protein